MVNDEASVRRAGREGLERRLPRPAPLERKNY